MWLDRTLAVGTTDFPGLPLVFLVVWLVLLVAALPARRERPSAAADASTQ